MKSTQHSERTFLRFSSAFGLVLALASAPAAAQTVRVEVVDDASGLPLPEVAVQGLDSAGSVLQTELTNLDGVAFLDRSPKLVAVKVSSLGYLDQSRPLDAESLTIRLEPQPLELSGLTAEVEGQVAGYSSLVGERQVRVSFWIP
jgi:hypothetical protein